MYFLKISEKIFISTNKYYILCIKEEICVYVYVYIPTHTYIYILVYMCMYACIYVRPYVHVYVFIYICVCTYTHIMCNLYIYFEIFEGIAGKMKYKYVILCIFWIFFILCLYISKITPLNTYNMTYFPCLNNMFPLILILRGVISKIYAIFPLKVGILD